MCAKGGPEALFRLKKVQDGFYTTRTRHIPNMRIEDLVRDEAKVALEDCFYQSNTIGRGGY